MINTISASDTFETWRVRTNEVIEFLNALPPEVQIVATLSTTVADHSQNISDITSLQGGLRTDVDDLVTELGLTNTAVGLLETTVGIHESEINNLETDLGDITLLTTTDKNSVVNAINEVVSILP